MLNDLKMMLGIDAHDTELDAKLNLIISLTTARLKRLLGGVDDIPEDMNYIILEIAIIRFNRIGSEGMASHTVEGESYSFADADFEKYANEIQEFLYSQKSDTKGGVRFL